MTNSESLESLHRQQEAAFMARNTEKLDLIGGVLDKVVTDGVVAGHPEANPPNSDTVRQAHEVPSVDQQFQAIVERFNEQGGN